MQKTKEPELTILPFIPQTAKEAKSYYNDISCKKHNYKKILKYCFLCGMMAAVGFVVGMLI